MKLPWYVFSKGSFLGSIAHSIGPFIFVPSDIYRDLKSRNPKPAHIALLIHEETHRKRQKEIGFIKFGIQYLFNSKFRFNEELLAVKESMKYLKKNGIPFDFNKKARSLSSYIYLWPVSKEYAERELKKLWDEI